MMAAISIQPRHDSYGGIVYLYETLELAVDALPDVVKLFEPDISPEELEEIDFANSYHNEEYSFITNHVLDKRSK